MCYYTFFSAVKKSGHETFIWTPPTFLSSPQSTTAVMGGCDFKTSSGMSRLGVSENGAYGIPQLLIAINGENTFSNWALLQRYLDTTTRDSGLMGDSQHQKPVFNPLVGEIQSGHKDV
jgi:hypothetical protein